MNQHLGALFVVVLMALMPMSAFSQPLSVAVSPAQIRGDMESELLDALVQSIEASFREFEISVQPEGVLTLHTIVHGVGIRVHLSFQVRDELTGTVVGGATAVGRTNVTLLDVASQVVRQELVPALQRYQPVQPLPQQEIVPETPALTITPAPWDIHPLALQVHTSSGFAPSAGVGLRWHPLANRLYTSFETDNATSDGIFISTQRLLAGASFVHPELPLQIALSTGASVMTTRVVEAFYVDWAWNVAKVSVEVPINQFTYFIRGGYSYGFSSKNSLLNEGFWQDWNRPTLSLGALWHW
jgi:hypothetical protein